MKNIFLIGCMAAGMLTGQLLTQRTARIHKEKMKVFDYDGLGSVGTVKALTHLIHEPRAPLSPFGQTSLGVTLISAP